jgi:hypothetical protein
LRKAYGEKMIYIIGMSHAINVLKAITQKEMSVTHENLSEVRSDEDFFAVEVAAIHNFDHKVKAYIVSPKSGWGNVAEFSVNKNGNININAAQGYVNLIDKIEKSNSTEVYSFFNGNEHSAMSMIQKYEPYDFYLPWRDDLEFLKGHQPVNFTIIRKQMQDALNPTIASLILMRTNLPNVKIYHVMPPPPVESAKIIKENPEIFKSILESFGITPFTIRYKYYLLAADIIKNSLKPYDIKIIDSPKQAENSNGSLMEEYRFAATHANEKYGSLVVKQIQMGASV